MSKKISMKELEKIIKEVIDPFYESINTLVSTYDKNISKKDIELKYNIIEKPEFDIENQKYLSGLIINCKGFSTLIGNVDTIYDLDRLSSILSSVVDSILLASEIEKEVDRINSILPEYKYAYGFLILRLATPNNVDVNTLKDFLQERKIIEEYPQSIGEEGNFTDNNLKKYSARELITFFDNYMYNLHNFASKTKDNSVKLHKISSRILDVKIMNLSLNFDLDSEKVEKLFKDLEDLKSLSEEYKKLFDSYDNRLNNFRNILKYINYDINKFNILNDVLKSYANAANESFDLTIEMFDTYKNNVAIVNKNVLDESLPFLTKMKGTLEEQIKLIKNLICSMELKSK